VTLVRTSGLRSDPLLDDDFEMLNLDSPRGKRASVDDQGAVIVGPFFPCARSLLPLHLVPFDTCAAWLFSL
jgi:hypothetical protein